MLFINIFLPCSALLTNFSLSTRLCCNFLQLCFLLACFFFFASVLLFLFFANRLPSLAAARNVFLFLFSLAVYVNVLASAWAKCRGQASFIDWAQKANASSLASSTAQFTHKTWATQLSRRFVDAFQAAIETKKITKKSWHFKWYFLCTSRKKLEKKYFQDKIRDNFFSRLRIIK